jgi:hypothetical protein
VIIKTDKLMRSRPASDHYPTCASLVRAVYPAVLPQEFQPKLILDHSCGSGVWLAVARERWPTAYTIGIEMMRLAQRPHGTTAFYNGMSFFRYAAAKRYGDNRPIDLIAGNPPYGKPHRKMAEFFTRLSLAMLPKGGYLVQLLRLEFLASEGRVQSLWRDHPPINVFTLGRRPSFTGDGKTDATEYAVYVWRKGAQNTTYTGGWLSWEWKHDPVLDAPVRERKFLPAPKEETDALERSIPATIDDLLPVSV